MECRRNNAMVLWCYCVRSKLVRIYAFSHGAKEMYVISGSSRTVSPVIIPKTLRFQGVHFLLLPSLLYCRASV
jgi:hypothetical protein